MTRMRRDVWKLASEWDAPVLWYARGVKALQSRHKIGDVTSWRYLAAIHGIDEQLWRSFGYLAADEPLPTTQEFAEDARQCQHRTWYFLPWHRGYLAAFEKIMLAAIVRLGGPGDWALPYWNYSDATNPKARTFPAVFASKSWPDGDDNPLFVERRYGTGNGTIVIRQQDVDIRSALREDTFAGTSVGGSPGFGGAATPFQHSGNRRAEGLLEQQPHDIIHGLIGGLLNNDDSSVLNLGLMSHPGIAALDPIFWLHHANIDRLWEVWLRRARVHENPTDRAWLDGPMGARKFIMPAPDGSRHRFVAQEMLDTTSPALDYAYEDASDPLGGEERLSARLGTLRFAAAPVRELTMPRTPQVELLGANAHPVQLVGQSVETSVRMDRPTQEKVVESFNALAADTPREPDRVFLNLENITGNNDAAIFDVYVGLGPTDAPEDHPDKLAGVVSLFGVRDATNMAEAHGGNGLSKVIEITDTIDRLHLTSALSQAELPIRFVASQGLGRGDIKIGRVSVYRQGR
jgi:tyrosinase